ncbi:hypothetical protein HWV62_45595 [Athelia sp. TMB]|nr:hypothetical protein HWV62_45595 [Athelia sp. TMB]
MLTPKSEASIPAAKASDVARAVAIYVIVCVAFTSVYWLHSLISFLCGSPTIAETSPLLPARAADVIVVFYMLFCTLYVTFYWFQLLLSYLYASRKASQLPAGSPSLLPTRYQASAPSSTPPPPTWTTEKDLETKQGGYATPVVGPAGAAGLVDEKAQSPTFGNSAVKEAAEPTSAKGQGDVVEKRGDLFANSSPSLGDAAPSTPPPAIAPVPVQEVQEATEGTESLQSSGVVVPADLIDSTPELPALVTSLDAQSPASQSTHSPVLQEDDVKTPVVRGYHVVSTEEAEESRGVQRTPAPAAEKAAETPAPAPAAPQKTLPSTPRKASDPGYHPAEPYSKTTADTNGSSSSFDVGKDRPVPPLGSIGKKGGLLNRTPSMSSTASGKKKGWLNRTPSVSSTASSKRKVGFLDKVRGEAKIVMGKIEHKQEKIEAGRRIRYGEGED